MALTKTGICNNTLVLLGQEPALLNVDTDTSVHAGYLKQQWDVAVDTAIRAHPWNFALDWKSIGSDTLATGEAKFGFTKRYTWPSDPWCLRIWKFDRAQHGERPLYRVADRYLYTDEGSPIYVEFLKRVEDVGRFDPNFATLLEMVLAAKTGFAITGAMSVAEKWEQSAERFRPAAHAIDSQESGYEEEDPGEFLESRIGP